MTVTAPRTRPGAYRKLGWIDIGDIPMPQHARTRLDEPATDVYPRAAAPAQPVVIRGPADVPEVGRRAAPALAAPGLPTMVIVIMLSAEALTGALWSHYLDNVRKSLDIASAHRYETHACGSEGTRRVIWYAEIRAAALHELRSDLEYYAGYLHAHDAHARISWVPCSPINL